MFANFYRYLKNWCAIEKPRAILFWYFRGRILYVKLKKATGSLTCLSHAPTNHVPSSREREASFVSFSYPFNFHPMCLLVLHPQPIHITAIFSSEKRVVNPSNRAASTRHTHAQSSCAFDLCFGVRSSKTSTPSTRKHASSRPRQRRPRREKCWILPQLWHQRLDAFMR